MDDFSLLFTPEAGGFSLRASCHLAGEAADCLLDQEIAALERACARMGQEIADAVAMGRLLFQAIFKGALRDLFQQSVEVAGQRSSLRILLKLSAAERLRALPWEMLHDGARFIANNPVTPVALCVEHGRAVHPARLSAPLRILFTSACPEGCQPLDLRGEEKRVLEALPDPARVQVEVERQLRLDRLRFLLQRAEAAGRPFHVWHHAGHARFDHAGEEPRFELDLEVERRREAAPAGEIATILEGCPHLALLVLNVCQGGAEGALASLMACRNLPTAIGFQTRIEDRAALVFAQSLYNGLLRLPLEVALTHARLNLAFEGSRPLNWSRPRIFTRTLPAEAGPRARQRPVDGR